MTVYKCDRCGKIYNLPDDINTRGKINNRIVCRIKIMGFDYEPLGYLDLCDDCSRTLVKWYGGDDDGNNDRIREKNGRARKEEGQDFD